MLHPASGHTHTHTHSYNMCSHCSSPMPLWRWPVTVTVSSTAATSLCSKFEPIITIRCAYYFAAICKIFCSLSPALPILLSWLCMASEIMRRATTITMLTATTVARRRCTCVHALLHFLYFIIFITIEWRWENGRGRETQTHTLHPIMHLVVDGCACVSQKRGKCFSQALWVCIKFEFPFRLDMTWKFVRVCVFVCAGFLTKKVVEVFLCLLVLVFVPTCSIFLCIFHATIVNT